MIYSNDIYQKIWWARNNVLPLNFWETFSCARVPKTVKPAVWKNTHLEIHNIHNRTTRQDNKKDCSFHKRKIHLSINLPHRFCSCFNCLNGFITSVSPITSLSFSNIYHFLSLFCIRVIFPVRGFRMGHWFVIRRVLEALFARFFLIIIYQWYGFCLYCFISYSICWWY